MAAPHPHGTLLHYVLDDDDRPVAVDIRAWIEWRVQNEHRVRVGFDVVAGTEVSTVFLGNACNYSGPPQLWETATWGPGRGNWDVRERYASIEAAREGHVAIVAELLRAQRSCS